MCSSGEPVPHTSSIHPKQHLHTFQQSPLAQLSIYTAMLFQQPSYTYAVPCWLSCKPWCSQREVKGTQVAAPAPPVCNSSLNSPSTAACCDFSSLRGPDIRYFYMSFFFSGLFILSPHTILLLFPPFTEAASNSLRNLEPAVQQLFPFSPVVPLRMELAPH